MAEEQNTPTGEFKSWTEAELREEQREVMSAMKELQKQADERDDKKGEFNADEEQRWDKLSDRYDGLGDELGNRDEIRKAAARAEERRQSLENREEELNRRNGRRTEPNAGEKRREGFTPKDPANREAETRAYVWRKWLDTKMTMALSPSEQRAMQVDNDSIGGSLVADEQFVNDLIKFVDDLVFIRQLADILPLTDADSVGIPSWDTDPADANWTSELATGGEDSSAATGKRKLTPHPIGKLIKISRTLVRKSAVPIVSFVQQRLAYKFAVSEEKAFLTGSGSNQPLGVFTASNDGISTSRDVSTGNTTTAIKADGLIEAKFALKQQYMNSPGLRWIFHRDAVKQIRKLKDGNGDYLWNRGLSGTPDTILEVPYLMSEFAPSTFTSGLYVGIIGDFSNYKIAESLRMEVQRLDELYAATNQVGLIGRMELDGMPAIEEAFARVTLAT